jgi:Zn-dependent protease
VVKRKKVHFTAKEWKDFGVVIIVLSFILSFNFWGAETFSASAGFKNWFISFIVVAVSLLIHHCSHWVYGLYHGYDVKHRLSWNALGVSVLITLVTGGRVLAFMAIGVFISLKKHARLGKKDKYNEIRDMHHVALIGPLVSLLLALGARSIGTDSFFVDRFFVFNLLFAAYSMLPFPPLDGSRIMFSSRLWYLFALGSIISFVLFIYSGSSFAIALNISLLIGAVAAWVGYMLFT